MDPLPIKRLPDRSGLIWTKHPVPYFRYSLLSHYPGLVHAVFTRHGGASHPPYDHLNVSYDVGDRPYCVTANLAIVRNALGARRLIYLEQVHGTHMIVIRAKDRATPLPEVPADALITDVPGLALLIKQADCQGIVLFDPRKGVVAVVHCGWRGNVGNILSRVVTRMEADFGCRACDLVAGIGPSLGPCCAEFVGHDTLFPTYFQAFRVNTAHFDLKAVSRRQLLDAGLRDDNIQVCEICTRCSTDLFYSYRGEGKTGRFATVAMLTPGGTAHADVH